MVLVRVLYGTETGTAEDTALDVADGILGSFRGARVHVSAADAALPLDKALACVPSSDPHVCVSADTPSADGDAEGDGSFADLLVFVVATAGQGEVPVTFKDMWRTLLRRSLPPGCLAGLNYAVLGLGDSGYALYNACAKRLDARLAQLGASRAVPLALADDRHPRGIYGAISSWTPELHKAVRRITGWPRAAPRADAEGGGDDYEVPSFGDARAPRYSVAAAVEDGDGAGAGAGDPLGPFAGSGVAARVASNTRITAEDHDQDVRHIVLEVPRAFEYVPGDVAAVMPSALPERVDAFLALFPDINPDAAIALSENVSGAGRAIDASAPPLPARTTARELFTRYLDVAAVPRSRFFARLAAHASDDAERDRLAYFGSPSGCDDIARYALRMRRTVAEALVDFSSARPPLEHLIDAVPRMRERYFSIASSPAASPGEVHLAVAVVKYKTAMREPRVGTCSNWLAGVAAGDPVPVRLRVSTLRVPRDPAAPAIMIGPGTGVAPFRAFLQDRRDASPGIEAADARRSAPWVLFFGCRKEKGDFLFGEELRACLQPPNGALHAAFSRDQDHKIYVQHRIRENGARMWELLAAGAHVYVAGSSGQMPKDVREAFVDIASEHGGLSAEDSEKFIARLEVTKRYVAETW